MRMNNKKRAYTLAEIMVVVLVLTIIFAAFAPFFTKRKMSKLSSKYSVWEYSDPISLDAYYDPGDPSYTGQLFFGITPNGKADVGTVFLPSAKIVLRSTEISADDSPNKMQRHIQFRYGRTATTDHGKFAGSWVMNTQNALMGSSYNNMLTDIVNGAKYNTAIGYNALDQITQARGNTAVGYGALNSVTTAQYNTAVGYMAGSNGGNTTGNTLLGAYSGAKASSRSTLIGYYAGYSAGNNDTYLGAFAGEKASGPSNTALGYKALYKASGNKNIALGVGALENLTGGSNNVAIGYKACSNLKTSSNKTCIGANSGPRSGTASDNYLKVINGNDTAERTYIGSHPKYYTGDAVLEIHNLEGSFSPGMSSIASNQGGSVSNTTTVINGNLIVRGRPYFTVGGKLQHFHDSNKVGDGMYYYGYGKSPQYYAVCSTYYESYNFGNCVNLNTSDRRLKNIGTLNNSGLDELKKLEIYNYTFKNDPNKIPQVGVIAQQLQKVFPNSVVEGDDGYLRIKWDEMFYAAINAIKTLDRKVTALAERITKVDTKISKLEKENIELKNQVDRISERIQKLKAQ